MFTASEKTSFEPFQLVNRFVRSSPLLCPPREAGEIQVGGLNVRTDGTPEASSYSDSCAGQVNDHFLPAAKNRKRDRNSDLRIG